MFPSKNPSRNMEWKCENERDGKQKIELKSQISRWMKDYSNKTWLFLVE